MGNTRHWRPLLAAVQKRNRDTYARGRAYLSSIDRLGLHVRGSERLPYTALAGFLSGAVMQKQDWMQ